MSRLRIVVIGLLIAILFPLLGTSSSVSQADVIVPLPVVSGLPLPLPSPSEVRVPLPIVTVQAPQPIKTVVIPRVIPTPVPGPTQPPVIIPGPTHTTVITRPDGSKVMVVTRTVPGPTKTVTKVVTTPVPGPTKTVYTTKFSPGQERIIKEKVRDAQRKFGLAGIIAGMIIAFILMVLIYRRGFRTGEIHDAKLLRDTI